MKRSVLPTRVFALVLTLTLIVSACSVRVAPAEQAAPTIDIAQQVTVIAGTFMAQVQTQAAMVTPTSTLPPVPPTSTLAPLPDFTQTALALPTVDTSITPTITPTTNPYANDPCVNQLLPDVLTGQKIKIRIDSPVDRPINVTVYLQQGPNQSVCGYRAYVLPGNETLAIYDLVEGCYSIWAWDPDPKTYFMVTNGTTCMNASQAWRFDINPNGSIKLNK
ncbi:MAG: hypothetical protein QM730_01145 [Anaerolineales bacterium]